MTKCLVGLMLLAAFTSHAQTVEVIAGQTEFPELLLENRLNAFNILGENSRLYGLIDGRFYEYDPIIEGRQQSLRIVK